jgi:hypothetical protein
MAGLTRSLTQVCGKHEGLWLGLRFAVMARAFSISRGDWNDYPRRVVFAPLEPFGFPAKGREKTPPGVGLASD